MLVQPDDGSGNAHVGGESLSARAAADLGTYDARAPRQHVFERTAVVWPGAYEHPVTDAGRFGGVVGGGFENLAAGADTFDAVLAHDGEQAAVDAGHPSWDVLVGGVHGMRRCGPCAVPAKCVARRASGGFGGLAE